MSAFSDWKYRVNYLSSLLHISPDALVKWEGEWDGKDGAW